MKHKGTLLTLLFIALLTAAYLLQQRSTIQKSASGSLIRLLPEAFDPSEVRRIELFRGESRDRGVALKKDDGIWNVTNFPGRRADQSKIEDLFNDLKIMEGDLRGDRPELYPVFLTSDEKAIHIVLYDKQGDEYSHLLVGKREPIFGGRFVRLKDDSRVYLSDKKLISYISGFGDNNERDPDHMRWLGR